MSMASSADLWTFIRNDATRLWSWRRASPVRKQIVDSLFAFASLNGCIADAQRMGFVNRSGKLRRLNASEVTEADHGYTLEVHGQERRRRERKT
jgi:hypothetical protein